MAQAFDITIIGGGITGLALAGLVARYQPNLRIAVIDAGAKVVLPHPNEYDLRVSAITRFSERLLRRVGCWQAIETQRVSPYTQMRVWDSADHAIDFDAHEIAQSKLGHIIENRVIKAALQATMSELSGVTLFDSTRVQSIAYDGVSKVVLDDDQVLKTNLIVGADGANSWVREQAGIAHRARDYQHHALVATIQTEKPHEHTCWQHFLESGPLAFLPLPEVNICSIVWSSHAEHIAMLKSKPQAEFGSALAQAFDHRLGECSLISDRASFPLIERHADRYVKPGLALIGDSAHTIHPLAGLGLNIGLMDVAHLAKVINDAISRRRDYTHIDTLRRYERARKANNQNVIWMMSFMQSFFSDQSSVLQKLRGLAMGVVNQQPIIKNAFIQRAMGLKGNLPELL